MNNTQSKIEKLIAKLCPNCSFEVANGGKKPVKTFFVLLANKPPDIFFSTLPTF